MTKAARIKELLFRNLPDREVADIVSTTCGYVRGVRHRLKAAGVAIPPPTAGQRKPRALVDTRRSFSAAEAARIRALDRQGISGSVIAQRFNRARSSICTLLRRASR